MSETPEADVLEAVLEAAQIGGWLTAIIRDSPRIA